MRTYAAAALLLLSPGLCVAQIEAIDVSADCLIGSAVTTAPPLLSDSFGTQLAAARTCLADNDSDCVERVTEDIDADTLNDDERAVLALLRGDTEALDGGSSRRARREYRRVLDESGVNRQIVRAATDRLVRLHLDDDDPDDALEQLQALECGDWTPEFLALQARAQFGLRNFEAAQLTIQNAIDSQQLAGGVVPAEWRSLQASSVRLAKTAADEGVICTKATSINSLIPREVCTTRAQREWEAEQAREWIRTGGEFGGIVEIQTID